MIFRAYCTVSGARLRCGLSSSSDVSDASFQEFISQSDAEVDSTIKQSFLSGSAYSEYYSNYLPKRADDILPNRITLKHYPVYSITSIVLTDASGTAVTTISGATFNQLSGGNYMDSNIFVDANAGIIELNKTSLNFVPQRTIVNYSAGYASVPTQINELSACLAGIRAWVYFLGGNYSRLNAYTLPETSFNKGDFYDRGLKIISELRAKAEEIFGNYTKKQRGQFGATSGGYF